MLLLLSAVILILAAPFAGDQTIKQGWMMVPTLIFPVMVPMYFFILPLDMTMCLIMMQDKAQDIRENYKRIIWLEIILMVLLLLAWLPYAVRLFNS